MATAAVKASADAVHALASIQGAPGARAAPVAAVSATCLAPGRNFKGTETWAKKVQQSSRQGSRVLTRATPVIAAAAAVQTKPAQYELPTWAKFEMGHHPVFWETANGNSPTSGELLTIYFNPSATDTMPNEEYGFAFNGGFNQPIMCGGEPRQMTRKDRGPSCTPFYIIKINVPVHAMTLEFSFTNGSDWVGPFFITMVVPPSLRGQPMSFFNEGLTKELSQEGACDTAIYPDAAYIQDRCLMPFSASHALGASCELDLVPGCTDQSSPFYDPLANVDDGTCQFDAE